MPLSDDERELKVENERMLGEGIHLLRQLRTRALETENADEQQSHLARAHALAKEMAAIILAKGSEEKPSPIDPAFRGHIKEIAEDYRGVDAGSGHGLPPSFSMRNLFRATDDMLARIEEKAGSFAEPSHRLSVDEMRYVVKEFLQGTNDLTIEGQRAFFEKGTRVGGILTGGSVYLEIVKDILEKYGEEGFSIDTFVIAVDKDAHRAVAETKALDHKVTSVLIVDDMIDGGGTNLTALWQLGASFPKATIRSGKGIDFPGDFQKRFEQPYRDHLFDMFQDFVNAIDAGKIEESTVLFREAERYAKEHNLQLLPGWYKAKARMERHAGKQTQEADADEPFAGAA